MFNYNPFRDLLGRASGAGPRKNQHHVLDEAGSVARKFLAGLTPDIVVRLLDALFQASGSGLKTDMQTDQTRLLMRLHAMIHERRDEFVQYIVQRYETELALALDLFIDKREQMKKPAMVSADQLELVDTIDIERMVWVRNLATRLQAKHNDLIFDLSARLATLSGVAEVPISLNPFRPGLMIDAIESAWLTIDPDKRQSLALLSRLTPQIIGDLSLFYLGIIGVLVNAGIEPVSSVIVVAPPPPPRSTAAPSAASPSTTTESTARAPSFFSRLQNLFRPSETQAHTTANSAHVLSQLVERLPPASNLPDGLTSPDSPAAQALSRLIPQEAFTHVLSALNHLQRAQWQKPEQFQQALAPSQTVATDGSAPPPLVNVVRSLQRSDVGQNATPLDAAIIELVARVFDFMFRDEGLADAIKVVLSRLQIPLLKAAMADPRFFEQDEHPARQLINTLAFAGSQWEESTGRQDPRFTTVEHAVQRIIQEFDEDIALFSRINAEVCECLRQWENDARVAARSDVEQAQQHALRTENQEMAQRVAQQAVEDRLRDRVIPVFLTHFLRQVWVGYLSKLLIQSQGEASQLEQAMMTIDNLLWSVEPKKETLERARLLARLPSIERELKNAAASLEWSPLEIRDFFRALDDRWAGALIGEPVIHEPMSPEQTTPISPTLIGNNSEENSEEDPTLVALMKLEVGAILEITREDGSRFCYKLGWISQGRTRFLLTNRLNTAPLIVTVRYLAECLLEKKLRVIDNAPLMDRALGNILDALAETRYSTEMKQKTGVY